MTIFKEIQNSYEDDRYWWGSIDLENGDTIKLNGDGTGENADGTRYEQVSEGVGEPYEDGSGYDEYRVIGWRKV